MQYFSFVFKMWSQFAWLNIDILWMVANKLYKAKPIFKKEIMYRALILWFFWQTSKLHFVQSCGQVKSSICNFCSISYCLCSCFIKSNVMFKYCIWFESSLKCHTTFYSEILLWLHRHVVFAGNSNIPCKQRVRFKTTKTLPALSLKCLKAHALLID